MRLTLLASISLFGLCGIAQADDATMSTSKPDPNVILADIAAGVATSSSMDIEAMLEHYAIPGAARATADSRASQKFVGDHERFILEMKGKYSATPVAGVSNAPVQSIESAALTLLSGQGSRYEVSDEERRQLLSLGDPKLGARRIAAEEASRRTMALPSFSDIRSSDPADHEPKNVFLDDWGVERSRGGGYSITRGGDAMTAIPVTLGAVIGEFGRIKSVVDDGDELYIIMESGDQIRGL